MPIDKRQIESLSQSADIPIGKAYPIFLVFFDLCGSTDFKTYCQERSIPDGIWIERQLIFLHRIIGLIQRFKGIVVKTIGDEVMGYFDDKTRPIDVLRCATDSHSLFRYISRYDNEGWRIKLRASIDYGTAHDCNLGLLSSPIIDPIGLVVDRCSRLNGEAKANEVLFSSSFFSVLDSENQKKHSKSKVEKILKGIGPAEYYRIAISE